MQSPTAKSARDRTSIFVEQGDTSLTFPETRARVDGNTSEKRTKAMVRVLRGCMEQGDTTLRRNHKSPDKQH